MWKLPFWTCRSIVENQFVRNLWIFFVMWTWNGIEVKILNFVEQSTGLNFINFFGGNLDFPKIKKLNKDCSNVWTSTKCENNAILKQDNTLKLFNVFKMAYSCGFGLSRNLEFPEFLQKSFKTSITDLPGWQVWRILSTAYAGTSLLLLRRRRPQRRVRLRKLARRWIRKF